MPATITTIPQVKQEILQDATPGGKWRRSSRRPDGKPASLRAFLMEKGNHDHAKVRLEFSGGGAVTYGHPVLKTAITEHYHGPQALFRITERTDVKYRFYDDQAKQEIWLFADPGTNVFEEVAWLEDVELVWEPGGRLVYRHQPTGEVVGHIPAPVVRAFNAGAGTLLSTTATMAAEPQADGSWLLRITVDAGWLTERFAAGDVVVIDPTTASTSSYSAATGFSNSRRLDRNQDGTLWLAYYDGSGGAKIRFAYSKDEGQTWTVSASDLTTNIGEVFSFFIDLDDYAHLAYRDSTNGAFKYRRGTPTADRTAWTWSGENTLYNPGTGAFYPDVVAHREGTGWKAHVVWSEESTQMVHYIPITISSDGTITVGSRSTLWDGSGSEQTWPSIDFYHTGDGKTVQGGTPHLFVVWYGSSTGTRYRKATYNSGSWTWEADRQLDTVSGGIYTSSCFDGSRTIAAYRNSGDTTAVKVAERDAADTTTTLRTPPALSDGTVIGVSVTYDDAGNIYLFALGNTSKDPKWVKFDRSAGTWGSWTVIEATDANQYSPTTKRGYFDGGPGSIECAYVTGTASPYNIRYDRTVVLNQTPTEPALSASPTAFDAADGTDITIEHNDPDTGDTMSAYALKRDVGGTIRWWNASTNAWDQTSEYWNAASGTSVTITKANNAGTWTNGTTPQLYAATKDEAGEAGPYNATAVQVTVSTKPTVSIDTPAAGGTITTDTLTVEWTYFDADGDAQSAYRVRLLDADIADAVLEDTGWVSSSTARSRTLSTTLENNHNYKVEVKVKDANGVESA